MDTYEYAMTFKTRPEVAAIFANKTAAEIKAMDSETAIINVFKKDERIKKVIDTKSWGEELESITYKFHAYYLDKALN